MTKGVRGAGRPGHGEDERCARLPPRQAARAVALAIDRLASRARLAPHVERALSTWLGAPRLAHVVVALEAATSLACTVTRARAERIHASLSARLLGAAAAVATLASPGARDAGEAALEFDRELVAQLARASSGPEHDARVELARAFACGLGASVEARERANAPASSLSVLLVAFDVSIGGHRATARMHVTEEVLLASCAALVRTPRPLPRALPVPIAFVRALARIPLRELRTLARGDVFVPDLVFDDLRGRFPGNAAADLVLVPRGRRLAFREVVPRSSSSPSPEIPTMQNRDMSARGTNLLPSLEGAEVEVTVEIARTELSIGELACLEPGDVLASFGAVTNRASLRVGGTLVALGELVEVDGALGVRILETSG